MVKANRQLPLTPTFTVALSAPSPGQPKSEPVAWDIMPWIAGVSVSDSVRKPATFTLDLVSREDENGTKFWSDDPRFVLGARVAVSFGYGDKVETVIAGEITALSPLFSTGSAPALTVSGEDLRWRLDTTPFNRDFKQRKYSEIAEDIC